MQLSDEQLVSRFKEGSMEAFEELVRRYETKIYNLVYRFMGNHADAGDLAQEAFIRAYRALSKFRGESSFSTWIYKVTANVCRDELRKQRRKKNISLDELEGGQREIAVADTSSLPEETFERRELQNRIQVYLNQLSEDHRLILLMREMQDMSYEEISEVMQCSMGTVKSRLSRARTALKKIMKSAGKL